MTETITVTVHAYSGSTYAGQFTGEESALNAYLASKGYTAGSEPSVEGDSIYADFAAAAASSAASAAASASAAATSATTAENAADSVDVAGDVVGTTDTQTITNKTIDADDNTISNLAHGAEVDDPSSGVHGVTGNVVGTTDTQTLTNKTLDLGDNTVTGTVGELQSVLSDGRVAGDFTTRAALVTWAGSNTPVDGAIYIADGVAYVGSTGATAISDMDGLVPALPAYPEHFGAAGNGSTDDTADVQAALDWAADFTGAVILGKPGSDYLIDTGLSIPINTGFRGPHPHGPGPSGSNADPAFDDMTGWLIVNSAATITLGGNSDVSGWNIRRKGMTFPTVDASAFAGTALTIDGQDATVRRNFCIGFERFVDLDGHQRPRIEDNAFDCVNGIRIQNCLDVPHVQNNHGWPFATIEAVTAATGGATLIRTGTAFAILGADWAVLHGNFSYGYYRGHYITANSVRAIGCGADNPVSGTTPQHTSSIGFDIAATRATLLGCNAAGNDTRGFSLSPPSNGDIRIIGAAVWGHSTHGIIAQGSGQVSAIGCSITNTTYGVTAADTNIKILIDDMVFENVTDDDIRVPVAATTDKVQIGRFTTDKAAGANIADSLVVPEVASASAISLPNTGEEVSITGTTDIGSINGYWAGRVVTLFFEGSLTVFNSTSGANNVRLSGGSNFTAGAGATLTIKHRGDQWYEVSRSAA